jgi:hypothetical protein
MAETPRFVHRNLNELERKQFIETYRDVEYQDAVFSLISQSDRSMMLWVVSIIVFILNTLRLSIEIESWYIILLIFILGIIGLQIVFVATHMEAHAFFLEYDLHVPTNTLLPKWTVYYYAFYHHHHSRADNWAPFLSYHNHDGARNVAAAHWTSFSMLSSKRILIIMLFLHIHPLIWVYFAGYEFACLVLPFAHRWQHVAASEQNIVCRILFQFLEKIGFVANHKDHIAHHDHTHPTVYQSFSSSGLYTEWIDHYLNEFWDYAFHEAIRTNSYPQAYIEPYVWFIDRFIIIGIPMLLKLYFLLTNVQ